MVIGLWSTIERAITFSLVRETAYNESPRRGHEFGPRKIARSAARIKRGSEIELRLGNQDAKLDWEYAPEYVYGIWQMLQQDQQEDSVLATGRIQTAQRFLELSFEIVGLNNRDLEVQDLEFM